MQNKLLLAGIGILIAVAVGGFLFTRSMGSKVSLPSQTRENPAAGGVTGQAGTEQTSEAVGVREIVVSGQEYSFSPSSISLRAGEKTRITFKNMGSAPHDFVITELGVKTAVISGGQEVSVGVTAPATGEYTFFCSVDGHRALGMEGSLKVE